MKWVLKESLSAEARRLLRDWEDAAMTIVAPAVFPVECASALYRKVKDGLIDVGQAQQLLGGLFKAGLKIIPPSTAVLGRSIEIADKYGQPHPYDSLYAATAERLQCEFWTPDRTFRDAVSGDLPFVRWLGERKGLV